MTECNALLRQYCEDASQAIRNPATEVFGCAVMFSSHCIIGFILSPLLVVTNNDIDYCPDYCSNTNIHDSPNPIVNRLNCFLHLSHVLLSTLKFYTIEAIFVMYYPLNIYPDVSLTSILQLYQTRWHFVP